MFRDPLIAAIRTAVAFLVTWLIAALAGWGAALDPEFEITLNAALFGLCIAGYNLLVGFLERKVHPYFGILLGVPKAPAYGEVGTQTPPPHQPLVGNPRTDRGAVPVATIGLVIGVVGFLLLILDALNVLAVPLVISVILVILGLALFVFGSRRDPYV